MSEYWCRAEPVEGLTVYLAGGVRGLTTLAFGSPTHEGEENAGDALLREARRQLEAYFHRDLRRFDLPLDLRGTPFQIKVWEALQSIPYGETRSYAELARSIDAAHAVRAVGAANGANPIGIIVPCHRVIASDGSLCGYAGGLPLKRLLLDLESAQRSVFA